MVRSGSRQRRFGVHAGAFLPLVACVVGFATLGCASETGLARPKTPVLDPFESQSPSEAQVCAIQTKAPAAKTEAAPAPSEDAVVLRDNGDAVATIRRGSYVCFFAQPGKHVLLAEQGATVKKTKLSAEAGRRYYLGLEPKGDESVLPRWIDENTAKRLIRFTSPTYGDAIAQ
ncbi:MAG: hypothetical protein U0169_26605 [Polyangiaceae bacterium]